MIDLKNVENYRENNRIEAKKALGGLPKSLWETYSAFANTYGGVILLGVKEEADKSLHAVRLPDPEKLLAEFWGIINDKSKVSVNILTQKQVKIVGVGENRFISIHVPRASRFDKPVFIGSDPFLGSYRRTGEGDYRCEEEEVKSMIRDATKVAEDMRPLPDGDYRELEKKSISSYRQAVLKNRPSTLLAQLSEEDFLFKTGVIARENTGKLRPTKAGLLMLGQWKSIKERFSNFRLFFETRTNEGKTKKEYRENVFSFFNRVSEDFRATLLDENAYLASLEALTNCLINADYNAKSGIYVTNKKSGLSFSNPGGFRMSVDQAKSGGVSDPRNLGLLRLFHFLGAGSGTGSGIPSVFANWCKNGRGMPVIRESFRPERVNVILPYAMETGRKNLFKTKAGKLSFGEEEKRVIIEFITERISATVGEISLALHLPSAEIKEMLEKLLEDGVLKKEGNAYSLKS